MGDEGNLHSGFPFFVDLPAEAAAAKQADRYGQMKGMFHENIEQGGLPDPNDPAHFEQARLRWSEFDEKPERRAALDRFRQLGGWRRDMVWPLAATPCVDAQFVPHGNCLIVNWVFEIGTLTMALNPTDQGLRSTLADHGSSGVDRPIFPSWRGTAPRPMVSHRLVTEMPL